MKRTVLVRCLVPRIMLMAALLVAAGSARALPQGAEEGAKPVNDAFRTRAEIYMAHGAADSAVMCADTFMIKTVRSMDTATDARFAAAQRRLRAAGEQSVVAGYHYLILFAIGFLFLVSIAVVVVLRRRRRNGTVLAGQCSEAFSVASQRAARQPGPELPEECRSVSTVLIREQTELLRTNLVVQQLLETAAVPGADRWAAFEREVVRCAPAAVRFVDRCPRPLAEAERRLCLLLLCGFVPTAAARLLDCSPQNVATMRTRLAVKFFGRCMTARDFDRCFLAATVRKCDA